MYCMDQHFINQPFKTTTTFVGEIILINKTHNDNNDKNTCYSKINVWYLLLPCMFLAVFSLFLFLYERFVMVHLNLSLCLHPFFFDCLFNYIIQYSLMKLIKTQFAEISSHLNYQLNAKIVKMACRSGRLFSFNKRIKSLNEYNYRRINRPYCLCQP